MAITVTIAGSNKTSSTLLNQLTIDYALGSDWTATFPVRDKDSTSFAYRPALDAEVTIADGATTLLHGTISRVEDKPIAPPHIGTLTVVTARAKSQVVDQIIVNEDYAAGQTLHDVVSDLRTTYLASYSITLDGSMATGPTLEAQTFKEVTLRDALNHLSTVTGYLWRITPSDVLEFFIAGAKMASYSLTAANKQSIGPVTWDKTREKYVNSVVLRYGTETQVEKTFTTTGTGSVDHWVLDYTPTINGGNGFLLSRGYVTEGAANLTLSEPGGGGSYTWTAATNTLTRAGGNLGLGVVISFIYTAQFPQSVTVENAGEIFVNGKFAGIFEASDIFDKDAATELATGILRRYLTVPKWVRLSTRQGFVMPGDQITLTFSDRTVSGNHIVTQVRATTIAKGTVVYALTCLSGDEMQESWTDRLRDALGTGGSNAAGGTVSGGVLPNLSGRFADDVVAHAGGFTSPDFESTLGVYQNSAMDGPALILGRSDQNYRWVICADSSYGGTPGSIGRLLVHPYRRGSSIECGLQLAEDGSDNFIILPGQNANLYLGDYAALMSGLGPSDSRIEGILCANAMATSGYFERSRTTRMGEYITPAYNAGDFTASAGSWTVDSGDITTYAYNLVGKEMTVAFEIGNTDVSATPNTLRIAIPGGFTSAKRMRNLIQSVDAGAASTVGVAIVSAGGTVIDLTKDLAATAWTTTSADNTGVFGEITFEVS